MMFVSTFSSENGTDIILKDRQKDYYQNVSLCQEGCVYNSFDRTKNKIICNCNNNKNNPNNKNIGNEVNNLFSNSNLKVLKCFYLNINIKSLLKNYGNYIFLFCEFGEIILAFNVLIKGFFPLMNNLNKIQNNIYYKSNNISKKLTKNPPIKNFNNNCNEKSNKNNLKFQNNSIESSDRKIFESNSNNNIIIYKQIGLYEENPSKKYVMNKEKINYTQKIYSNEEINDLNYNESLLIDNRNFILMYYHFLQYSQLLIFTFITKTDFNLRSIKISLFLFSFIIYLTFNTLFFTDETMSHIYNKGGTFDFIYNLPKTIFSSLCCGIINFLLKFLSLSQNDIKMLNKIKNEKEKFFKLSKLMKCWKTKIIIFYLLIFILMGLFHVYVITFCMVYSNTQKHLIKSTLISFCLSMIYPFGICFFTALFRILSLKYKNKILFNFSKILKLF